jgi:hypothetical protein
MQRARSLHRCAFTSLPDLVDAISTWTELRNENPQPFTWHTIAADVVTTIRRGRATPFTSHIKDAAPVWLPSKRGVAGERP